MKMFFRLIVKFLCIFFLFVVDGGKLGAIFSWENFPKIAIKLNFPILTCKGFSGRYINDFNATSSFEPLYDYDNTKTEVDKIPLQQEATKSDDNLEIYPDPEEFHRKMLNKTRMENQHHDDTVIKICKLWCRVIPINI